MYVSTDVATEQNVTVEQSIVTDQNTVADQNIQNNSYGYELDGGESGRRQGSSNVRTGCLQHFLMVSEFREVKNMFDLTKEQVLQTLANYPVCRKTPCFSYGDI